MRYHSVITGTDPTWGDAAWGKWTPPKQAAPSAQAANNGVQIAPESKGAFAMALGHWSRTTNSHISLVKTQVGTETDRFM